MNRHLIPLAAALATVTLAMPAFAAPPSAAPAAETSPSAATTRAPASTATAGPRATAADATPADAVALLRAAGYADVREVEFEDGLWEAEVRRADGLWAEVAVDPSTGEVFDARSPKPLLDLPAVLAAIEHAGYRQVHDIERDGALWDADAVASDGSRVELRVSGHDGRIVAVSHDAD